MTRVPVEADAEDYAGGGKVGDEEEGNFLFSITISNG
jgi:hypothetical protein